MRTSGRKFTLLKFKKQWFNSIIEKIKDLINYGIKTVLPVNYQGTGECEVLI